MFCIFQLKQRNSMPPEVKLITSQSLVLLQFVKKDKNFMHHISRVRYMHDRLAMQFLCPSLSIFSP